MTTQDKTSKIDVGDACILYAVFCRYCSNEAIGPWHVHTNRRGEFRIFTSMQRAISSLRSCARVKVKERTAEGTWLKKGYRPDLYAEFKVVEYIPSKQA